MEVQDLEALPDQDYFLSLGAGQYQIPLIEAARRRGLAIMAVDRNPLAPGFEKADLQLHASILKPFWIYRAIEEHFPRGRIKAVGCRSYGPAVLSSSYLARRFGVHGSNPHSILKFQDKNRLKAYLGANGIGVPERVQWKPGKDPAEALRKRGNWIARNGKGSAKQGIALLSTLEEKRAYLEKNGKRKTSNRSLFIEKFVQGKEFIVYGVVISGSFHCLTITEKVSSDQPPLFADRRHLFPARMTEEEAREMVALCQKIVDLCGYDNGPFFSEFILPTRGKNRKPLLVECQPEVGGEFIADELVPRLLGLNYFDLLVDLMVDGPEAARKNLIGAGLDPAPTNLDHLFNPGKAAVLSYILPTRATIQDLRMPVSMQKDPTYAFLKPLLPRGHSMDPQKGNADRPAAFMLIDSIGRKDELINRADQYENQIRVIPAHKSRSSRKSRNAQNHSRRSRLALSVSLWKPLV